jgi:hypothetical protein
VSLAASWVFNGGRGLKVGGGGRGEKWSCWLSGYCCSLLRSKHTPTRKKGHVRKKFMQGELGAASWVGLGWEGVGRAGRRLLLQLRSARPGASGGMFART